MSAAVKPENFPWLSPYLIVEDIKRSADFYTNAFKFEIKDTSPPINDESQHAEFSYKDQVIMLGKQGAFGGSSKTPKNAGIEPGFNLYLYVENVDDFFKHAVASGATPIMEPNDVFWGDRMCSVKDLDGHHWAFATHIGTE